MSSREVKDYLSNHLVPQLLESLLTGLLYHCPEDPISFLQSCLIRTRQLGGPQAITWDTFIHLDRDKLRPGAPVIHPEPTRTPSVPTLTPLLVPVTPSVSPKTTQIPPIIPPIPQKSPMTPQTPSPRPLTTPSIHTLSLLAPIIPQIPPAPTVTPVTHYGPQLPYFKPNTSILPPLRPSVSSIHHKTPSGTPQTVTEPRVLLLTPPGPAGTPPVPPFVHNEMKEEDIKSGSSEVRSQLSIDSDSDMTESSGLLQEVSILTPQRPRPLIIFIIGGPGSGKGSQTAKLACCFGLRVVSLDNLLRKQLLSHASPSRKWEVISEMMSHGEIGPQEETISALRRQLIGQEEIRGFIVDGFPRDIHQALSFQEQIGAPDLVILLLCSNETLNCRLQQRATRLGLLGDSNHTFWKRVDTFQRDIVSVRRYYSQALLLTQVDADRDEEMVFADLSSVMREKLQLKEQSDPVDIQECSSVVPDVPFNFSSVNQ